jgi:hypothetical protein
MEIKRCGSQPSNKGPADWFTGSVRIDSPFKGTDPARVAGAIVTFEGTAFVCFVYFVVQLCVSASPRFIFSGKPIRRLSW